MKKEIDIFAGWTKGKSYTAAVVIVVATALELLGYETLSKAIWGLAGALGIVGFRHAISKAVLDIKAGNKMDDTAFKH